MEKVITIRGLKFAPCRDGKDKWVVEADGGNMSVWEGKLAERLNLRINQKVSVEIRPAQEGTNYLPTITDMNDASDGTVLQETQEGKRSLNGQKQAIGRHNTERANKLYERILPGKDKSIIAQCLVKAVIGQGNWPNPWTHKAAVKLYKETLELLE